MSNQCKINLSDKENAVFVDLRTKLASIANDGGDKQTIDTAGEYKSAYQAVTDAREKLVANTQNSRVLLRAAELFLQHAQDTETFKAL